MVHVKDVKRLQLVLIVNAVFQFIIKRSQKVNKGINKMGTRADFYVGKGLNAEWLGSIAWDGYPDGIPKEILNCTNVESYRELVKMFINNREDGTKPEDGWPWPWETSSTTDYAYAFEKNKVFASCFGHEWFDPIETQPEEDDGPKVVIFPKMNTETKCVTGTIKSTTTWGKRSGLIIV
jgi:hypothetical protein